MADSQPAVISDTGEPAALSHGEYVIPADVVSMIGDGNSEAGAKILDGLLVDIRKAKGVKDGKQPKELGGKMKPAVPMPAMKMGGLARYAEGGKVKSNDAVLFDVEDPNDISQLLDKRDEIAKEIQDYQNNGDVYSFEIAKTREPALERIQQRIDLLRKKDIPYKSPVPNSPMGFNSGGKVPTSIQGLLRTLGIKL